MHYAATLFSLAYCVLIGATAAHAVTCRDTTISASNPDSSYSADPVYATVTDSRSGLMWKKCSEGQEWDGVICLGTKGSYPWSAALARGLSDRTGGYSDWRLPNIKELSSLVEECRYNPSINEAIFPATPSSYFWSGSPYADFSRLAWFVDFFGGYAYSADRSNVYSVRLVRGGRHLDTFDALAGATSYTLVLARGWNLVGVSVEASITAASTFSDAAKVTSVWKWNPISSKWAFYTPTQIDGGAAYADGNGYDTLTTINPGEGFWVNANTAFSVPLSAGAAIQSSSFKPAVSNPVTVGGVHALPPGWSLVATGDSPTPAQFNEAITTAYSTPPPTAQVFANLTTLWAWDATKQNWYFWAPALVNSGGLSSYISSKNYLDPATMPSTPPGALSPTTGFWVKMP